MSTLNSLTSITESLFGQLDDGQQVKQYVLRNNKNIEVALLSYGATIQFIKVLDKNNISTNIVLGLNTLEEYTNKTLNRYFNCIIGRVANRISNGEFKLNGKIYQLDRNEGNNFLHGGHMGFSWVCFLKSYESIFQLF